MRKRFHIISFMFLFSIYKVYIIWRMENGARVCIYICLYDGILKYVYYIDTHIDDMGMELK